MADETQDQELTFCEKASKNIITLSRIFGDFFISTDPIPVTWYLPGGRRVVSEVPSLKMIISSQYKALANAGITVNWRGEYIANVTYRVGDGVMCNGECWVNTVSDNQNSDVPSQDNGWTRCADCCCIDEF